MADEKKGITVKIDADLHAEIRQFIERSGMTMAEFVSKALYNELHPKIQPQEVKYTGPTRTMAFQMPEDMFQRLKEYLHRHNITQKDFVLGLVEAELNRDQELRNAQIAETNEPEEDEAEEPDEEELEDEDFDEDEDESEELDDDEELDDEESEDEDFYEDEDESEELDDEEEPEDEGSEDEDFDEDEDESEEIDEDESEEEAVSMAM